MKVRISCPVTDMEKALVRDDPDRLFELLGDSPIDGCCRVQSESGAVWHLRRVCLDVVPRKEVSE